MSTSGKEFGLNKKIAHFNENLLIWILLIIVSYWVGIFKEVLPLGNNLSEIGNLK
jgi:hypothetical protein